MFIQLWNGATVTAPLTGPTFSWPGGRGAMYIFASSFGSSVFEISVLPTEAGPTAVSPMPVLSNITSNGYYEFSAPKGTMYFAIGGTGTVSTLIVEIATAERE